MLKRFNPFNKLAGLLFKTRPYEAKTIQLSNEDYFVRAIKFEDIKDLLSIEREVYAGEMPWTKTAFLMELQATDPHLYLLIQKKEKRSVLLVVDCLGKMRTLQMSQFLLPIKEKGSVVF